MNLLKKIFTTKIYVDAWFHYAMNIVMWFAVLVTVAKQFKE